MLLQILYLIIVILKAGEKVDYNTPYTFNKEHIINSSLGLTKVPLIPSITFVEMLPLQPRL